MESTAQREKMDSTNASSRGSFHFRKMSIQLLSRHALLKMEGLKHVEEKEDDGKFETKLDVSGFKPEEIKIQLHGKELIVCGKRTLEDGRANRSRGFSHRVLLPEDVVVSSVRSRLSKEGLLMVEASRDPALLPRERAVDVLLETNETEDEPKPFTRDEPADTKLE